MSYITKKSVNIPAFLKKTYQMLEDLQNQSVIQWSPNGVGFLILNQEILTKIVLPKYFKHANYSSFIRQLNMYDFHKIRKGNIQNYFHHDKFVRHDLESIKLIKRKPQKKKGKYSEEIKQKKNKVQTRNSINSIKQKSQENILKISQKYQHIYDEERDCNNNLRLSEMQMDRSINEQHESVQQNDSAKMSINNQIHERYLQASRQILVPSHNNIFLFISPYQLANFGMLM